MPPNSSKRGDYNKVGNRTGVVEAYKPSLHVFGVKQKQVHFRVDEKLHESSKNILEQHGLSISDFAQFLFSRLGMQDRAVLELVAEFQLEKMDAISRNKNVSEVKNNKAQAELLFQLIAEDNKTT